MSYLEAWISQGLLSEIDRHFADCILRLSGDGGPELWLAAALASKAVQEGHVCLDLMSAGSLAPVEDCRAPASTPACPPWEDWRKKLGRSKAVGVPGDYRPLVLDGAGRLYLYRYWRYEKTLADYLVARVRARAVPVDLPLLSEGLRRLFGGSTGECPDFQKIAACLAVSRPLAVITGGPGTGKTSTVVKILALLLEQAKGSRLRVALAAPTGKAAARLSESVKLAKRNLTFLPAVTSLIPEEASTLHRLLGSVPGGSRFRFDAANPLPVDAVAVDEASMIDLPLMAKLVQALPERARLILLGDRDQLASVQPGAVFGDICGKGATRAYSMGFRRMIEEGTGEAFAAGPAEVAPAGLQDAIVTLQRSYRFKEGSGIGAVARLVNEGRGLEAHETAAGGRFNDIAWKDLPASGFLESALEEIILDGYVPYLQAPTPEAAFEAFGRFRILCALRRGPHGVTAVNQAVMNILGRRGFINPAERWFPGQPVLVTCNDYQLKLFNGDVGIVRVDAENQGEGGQKRVYFPAEGATFRRILPMRLPEHETVYAMTVHKSQGSEFDRVLLILPQSDAQVLTRELIYTGITRARKRVEIWGSSVFFVEAAGRRIERTSGLRDALWSTPRAPDRFGT